LSDALSPAEIPEGERVNDGLPQDLESSIRAYGLRYFKIKLFADAERDLARLRQLGRHILRRYARRYASPKTRTDRGPIATLNGVWIDPALPVLEQQQKEAWGALLDAGQFAGFCLYGQGFSIS
jgi:hypothetical protein